jgi:hypothetical protein
VAGAGCAACAPPVIAGTASLTAISPQAMDMIALVRTEFSV